MSRFTCADCRAHLPRFRERTLSWRLNRQVVAHLRQCDDCLRRAEQEKVKPVLSAGTTPHTMKPHASGTGQAWVTWGVVLFVLTYVIVSLVCFAVDQGTEEAVEKRVRDWAILRYPQGALGEREIDWTSWLPYYRREVHYPLLEQTDTGSNRRGTVIVTHRAWQRQVVVRLDQPEPVLVLRLPGEAGERETESTWAALEQLPQSVQVDMAVSTRHFLSPLAMADMFERYSFQLSHIYTYGGETLDERRIFPPLALVLRTPQGGDLTLEESRDTLLARLQSVARHPVIAEEHSIWQKRHAYMAEHGFQAYGALVRGTPDELMRLREVLELQQASIIRIDWVY